MISSMRRDALTEELLNETHDQNLCPLLIDVALFT